MNRKDLEELKELTFGEFLIEVTDFVLDQAFLVCIALAFFGGALAESCAGQQYHQCLKGSETCRIQTCKRLVIEGDKKTCEEWK